jgi:hypothetical protein
MMGGPGGHLTDVSDRAGESFRKLHIGRGLAIGDLLAWVHPGGSNGSRCVGRRDKSITTKG